MYFRDPVGVESDGSGVAFFAACLDEILYEYTPATYKPRVMSVRSLTLEAKSVIERVASGAMDRARVYPILEELRGRLHNDSVAKSLLPFPPDYYTAYAKDEDLKSVKVRLGLLRNKLAGGRYRGALQHEIIRLCQTDHEKGFIRESARNWVSATNGIGFSRQFMLAKVVAEFFSEGGEKYSSASDLARFFDNFDIAPGDFEVAFSVSDVVVELTDFLDRFRCEVVATDSPSLDEFSRIGLSPASNERLVMVKEVSARDIYSARTMAERRLERVSDFFSIFHHKNRIKWQSESVVRRAEEEGALVCARTSSVKRSRDNVPKKASQKLALKVGELNFSDKESVGRFISVVRLHGSAQEAASPEAQLVNLWTAMEVLVSRESASKLRGVKQCITPFLVYGYFDRLLYALAGDLYRWKRNQISRILKKTDLSNWSQHQKVAAVLVDDSFESLREELYGLLDGFPLLKNRCFQISKLITSTKRLDEAVKSHEQRVAWQIERIYRARNSIVHDGSAPIQVDALTENAHEYLDSFIDRFFILCAEMKAVSTLDEAIVYQTKLYGDWRKLLGEKSAGTASVENVRSYCALDAHQRGSLGS